MGRTIKIFEDEAEVHNGTCYVNTVIFTGRIYGELKKTVGDGVKFSLKISNGKDDKTGEWRKSTFADCTAFREVANQILKDYKQGDEIWILAKYYCKEHEGKYYKGFVVREVLNGNKTEDNNVDKNNNNFEDFNIDDLPFFN